MPQIGLAPAGANEVDHLGELVVGCPRRDCEISGRSSGPSSPVTLLPQHTNVIEQA